MPSRPKCSLEEEEVKPEETTEEKEEEEDKIQEEKIALQIQVKGEVTKVRTKAK